MKGIIWRVIAKRWGFPGGLFLLSLVVDLSIMSGDANATRLWWKPTTTPIAKKVLYL